MVRGEQRGGETINAQHSRLRQNPTGAQVIGLSGLSCYYDCPAALDILAMASAERRFISSGETSSMCVATPPVMPERIGEFAIAIAPELVFEGHSRFGASLNGPIEQSIHVFGVQEQGNGVRARRIGRGSHPGKLIVDHD